MTCIGAFGRDLGTVAATALASAAAAATLDFFYPLIIYYSFYIRAVVVSYEKFLCAFLLILHLISLRFRSSSAMFWVSSTIFLFIFYSFLVLLILFFFTSILFCSCHDLVMF